MMQVGVYMTPELYFTDKQLIPGTRAYPSLTVTYPSQVHLDRLGQTQVLCSGAQVIGGDSGGCVHDP